MASAWSFNDLLHTPKETHPNGVSPWICMWVSLPAFYVVIWRLRNLALNMALMSSRRK